MISASLFGKGQLHETVDEDAFALGEDVEVVACAN
jgi:hypothetical protein